MFRANKTVKVEEIVEYSDMICWRGLSLIRAIIRLNEVLNAGIKGSDRKGEMTTFKFFMVEVEGFETFTLLVISNATNLVSSQYPFGEVFLLQ